MENLRKLLINEIGEFNENTREGLKNQYICIEINCENTIVIYQSQLTQKYEIYISTPKEDREYKEFKTQKGAINYIKKLLNIK